MTRVQVWLCVTASSLVLASVLWATLVMAAPSSQPDVRPAAATFTVTTTADTNTCGTPCSLRGAIAVANSGDNIVIPGGVYTLTLGSNLIIDKSLTLEGAGSGDTIIQAGTSTADASFNVFSMFGGDVNISGVTIRHGRLSGSFPTGSGGGIYAFRTTLGVTDSNINDNWALGVGGGIFISSGTLWVTGSTINGNSAEEGGGGIVSISSTVTVAESNISGNSAVRFRGGAMSSTAGVTTVTNSSVRGNSAGGDGGGIFSEVGNTLTVINSIISGNSAGGNGGGFFGRSISGRTGDTLTVINSIISGNSAGGDGGGIFARESAGVRLNTSIISGNSAGRNGGGVYSSSALTVTATTISGNSAIAGGGMYNRGGRVTIIDSTVTDNSATSGGAIFGFAILLGGQVFGTVTVKSSSISGNRAEYGGGIINGGTVMVTAGTISDNSARLSGGGIWNSGTAYLFSTIIAGNRAPDEPDCSGLPTSLGYNLIGDDTGCGFAPVTGDLVNVDPVLGPLRDNSGPTFTHALLAGSPAIDHIPLENCIVTTDQRGVLRPQGLACDIGAFEFTDDIRPTAFNQTVTTTGDSPVTIVLTASDSDTGDTLTFIIVYLPASGDLFEGATLTGDKITTGDRVLTGDTVTYKARLGFAGADRFEFKANDGTGDGNVATVTIVVNKPIVKGTVSLEGMPNPISGARITFSTGDRTIVRVFSDPSNGGQIISQSSPAI